jgi:hypothetical protein
MYLSKSKTTPRNKMSAKKKYSQLSLSANSLWFFFWLLRCTDINTQFIICLKSMLLQLHIWQNFIHRASEKFLFTYYFSHLIYKQVLFYTRVTFLNNFAQSNTKFTFKTVYFLGVRGLTTSSYIVYDCTSCVCVQIYM